MLKKMAGAAVLAALTAAAPARAAGSRIVLQLSGPAEFEFAGYYAALWQGFYRAAGLDVAIRPDTAPHGTVLDPIREVGDGNAQFGVAPAAALVIRAAQGQPLLLLAPIFQRSGAATYYRAADDYASPGALTGAKLGRLPASDPLDIETATALKAEGVGPDKLNALPLRRGEAVGALAAHIVDAVPGSAWQFPWRAHEKRLAVKSINPADYRVEYYGDTLFAGQRFAADHPNIVRGFRTASLQGWDYALRHPDDIAARLLKALPHPPGISDAAGFAHYQAELARALARYPAIPLGHSNPVRWERIEANLAGAGALVRTEQPADFLYDPEAAARRSDDLHSFAKLGAALLFALAVGAWLGWRRHRDRRGKRPAVDARAPAAAAPLPDTAARAAPAILPLPADADLNALIGGLERAIRRRLPKGATCRLSLLPQLWRSRADPAEVRRLVLDVVAAAVVDLKPGGELVVGTRNYAFDEASLAGAPEARLGDYVRVTVRDEGAGLSERALAQIFDRAGSPRPPVAAAAAALRAAGGFARVESAEAVGTAVHLYFPRAAAGGERPPAPAEAAE